MQFSPQQHAYAVLMAARQRQQMGVAPYSVMPMGVPVPPVAFSMAMVPQPQAPPRGAAPQRGRGGRQQNQKPRPPKSEHGTAKRAADPVEDSSAAKKSKTFEMPPSLLELIPPKYRYAATVGNTPEEVEKWKADRRSKYPAAASEPIRSEDAARPAKAGRPCKFFMSGTCKWGSKCKDVHDEAAKAQRAIQDRKKREEQQRKEAAGKHGLLKALIAKDMLRETSAILQCLRYIREHNFLQGEPLAAALVEVTASGAPTAGAGEVAAADSAPKPSLVNYSDSDDSGSDEDGPPIAHKNHY